MSRESNIMKNTAIYGIGNFGSKILTYLMVLLYTHYISSNSLGYYDLIITTISLLLPIIMFSFDEGIYRWLIDSNNKNKSVIISTCLKAIIISTLFVNCILIIFNFFVKIKYIGFIISLLTSMAIYQLLLSAIRGFSNSKVYAISGIINGFIDLILELVCLVILQMGIEGILLSKIIANLITTGYLYNKQTEFKRCLSQKFNLNIFKSLLSYSLPLIPNSVSWWIVNSSDRYIILFFLGASYNGIYAISSKFPTIITTITGIIYFSLQESIIKEYNSLDRDQFYSKIFEKYYMFLFFLIICAIPVTKLIVQWFVGVEYGDAWQYTSFLYISTVFSALSSFLGIGYQISRETERSVLSTVIAAIVNIIVNVSLIRFIGLYAASISTMIAYMFLFVLRFRHSKKYFNLKINWQQFSFLFFLAIVSTLITYIPNIFFIILCVILFVIIFVLTNRNTLLELLKK